MLRLAVGLFFIVLPVLELAVLIRTGQAIGFWATMALVVGAALAGSVVLSRQNFTAPSQTLEALSQGRAPVAQVLDNLFLMLAGVLLLTPGLITDAVALVLLVPPMRRVIARWSMRHVLNLVDVHVEVNGRTADTDAGARTYRRADTPDGPVIDGEFERLSETSTEHRHRNEPHPR